MPLCVLAPRLSSEACRRIITVVKPEAQSQPPNNCRKANEGSAASSKEYPSCKKKGTLLHHWMLSEPYYTHIMCMLKLLPLATVLLVFTVAHSLKFWKQSIITGHIVATALNPGPSTQHLPLLLWYHVIQDTKTM